MLLKSRAKLLSLLMVCWLPVAQAQASQTIITPSEFKWTTAKDMPPGVQYTILAGDPLSKNHFIARVKFPANYVVPAHMHNIPEYDTVISGTYYLGDGRIADAKKGIALHPGDFAFIPSGSTHYGYTKTETVIQISSDGPWGMIYKDNS